MSDAAPAAPDTGADTAPARRDRSWLALLAGIVFVIAVATTFSLVMTRDDTTEPTPAFSAVVVDQFDRPSSNDGLGTGWTEHAGGFGIEGGFAVLRQPVTTGDNLATADLGSAQQAVNLKIAGTAQCGVVARYEDPLNYVALVRVHAFAVWNLIEVKDGKETLLDKVPDEDANTVNVTLTATDGVISANVGLHTTTLVREPAVSGTRAGLIARGDGAGECSWDDVVAQRAN